LAVVVFGMKNVTLSLRQNSETIHYLQWGWCMECTTSKEWVDVAEHLIQRRIDHSSSHTVEKL